MQDLTISTLQASYASGELTPRKLVKELLQKIAAADNPAVWIYPLTEAELEPYLQRLESSDPSTLPLYGIPFAIKDNIDLACVPTTAACEAYGYTPELSAPVVEKLLQAGAIPMGKTNLDQFATGLVGVRSPYGVPRNPIAPDRVPGGSSSGSAVALSEGLVSFSLGTDTAGSGRVPAMFNKLWGLKPSRGRLSTSGVVPACRTLDCVSIFALNAGDGQEVLKVAEGFDSADAYSQPTRDVALPKSKRLGVPKPEQLLFFSDVDYQPVWLKALDDLRAQGWDIVEVDFEPFLKAARLLYEGPWVSERTTALKDFLESNADDFFPATRSIIGGGVGNTACEAFAATYKLADLKRESEAVWRGLTAIVTPTAGGFPSLADLEADPIGPNSQLGYYTNFMNLLDLCAVAAPAGETESGLPFGLTWIAPRDADKALVDFAANGPLGTNAAAGDRISILLFGAHMTGLPLNEQVLGLGGEFVAEVQTAPLYKMIYLPEPAPHRPGIIRVGEGGVRIAAEEWSFPKAALGEFLSTIQQPLGLGQLELSDGRKVHGFLCEAEAAEAAEDISSTGGWRGYLAR
ncbi:allophanate hydrolase [Coraliomargarita akajimensis]|uniref:Allophanate hydrolase n=1 Tax=Coraliomargarita akajimensis (strain DSM 45221 / IAM 15411 / JCM 23193 / KCTC 12865 / 04OKA010-24) TaxID=583355 RepID=D5ELF0_CORAD|nr:allophanate hydrolase [Coraliomargarita akajimensis]ADE55086.1 allophanate hydrolase [Coraliomargarita akajimensis DSM 45221]